MASELTGQTIAIPVADGFEQSELAEPESALEKAGAATEIVLPGNGEVRGWKDKDRNDRSSVDAFDTADVNSYDGLLRPGGVINPDRPRINRRAVDFVKSFFDAGKPVAAICHGSWTLVEAGVLHGRTVTSWPSLQTDIRNAGGNWVDREVVNGNGLVTSREHADIPAFNRKMIEEFGERRHRRQAS
jgi:protease I